MSAYNKCCIRVETIDASKARASVSLFGWRMIQRGFVWPSCDMRWLVYSAGYFYKRRPCNPRW